MMASWHCQCSQPSHAPNPSPLDWLSLVWCQELTRVRAPTHFPERPQLLQSNQPRYWTIALLTYWLELDTSFKSTLWSGYPTQHSSLHCNTPFHAGKLDTVLMLTRLQAALVAAPLTISLCSVLNIWGTPSLETTCTSLPSPGSLP